MGFKFLEQKLVSAFQWYGELVGRRPFPFLVAPLILTLLVGPGLIIMKYDDDAMMLFTPYNAPSRREQVIARQFAHMATPNRTSGGGFEYPMSSDKPFSDMWFEIMVSSSENLMTQHSWTLISDLLHDIYNNFTCQVDDWVPLEADSATNEKFVAGSKPSSPHILHYKPDFCDSKRGCIQLDTMVDRVRDFLNETKYGHNPKVRLTYPIMYVWDRPFNWGQYILGVKYDPNTGKLESAKILLLYLQFQVNSGDSRSQKAAQSCIRQLNKYVYDRNRVVPELKEAGIRLSALSEPVVADEVSLIQAVMAPYLVATILLIIAFIAVTSFKRKFAVWSLVGAGMGVLTVGLSLLASFGFLCLCGVHMNFVVAVTPFLVLCVGIDNDFLVTSAWRQTADGHSSVQRRMGRAFADCGPSLTITSINDILCFGIGYLSETPAVADFCLHTCVALLFRFLFQLTFFAALTAYIGNREILIEEQLNEKKRLHFAIFKTPSIAPADPLPKKSLSPTVIDFTDLQRTVSVMSTPKKEHQRIHEFFRLQYASFLMRKSVRAITAVLYAVYIVAAVYGAAKWMIEITPKKLFFDDSPVQEILADGDRYAMPELSIGRVYVTAPPDFRYKANVIRFLQFVQDLENLDDGNFSQNFTVSKTDRTDVWIRPYSDFLQYMHPSDEDQDGQDTYQADFYDYFPDFLQSSDYSRFMNDLRFKKDSHNESAPIKLDKFQFVVTYFRPPHYQFCQEDHVEMMLRWRAVCRNYSEFEAIVYDGFQMNSYFDQRLTLAPTCLQTMGIALVAMSIVTALLMPDMRSMFFICLSFLSVDVGVIAGLNLFKSDLDPISLAFVLMTIGFSVYYTARVCYCYQSASRSMSSEEKMRRTMETVGWPILQGALATLLGIVSTFFLHCYMIRVLWRTIILIVVIGLLHGLLIMPIIMAAFDRPSSPLVEFRTHVAKRRRRKDTQMGHSPDTLSECSSQ